jgi:succinoglycan biosynthesis transport protein ExoP
VAVTEAMRGLRMNLLHAHGTAGPIIVTVGSADAGAGKTFVASNLALSFAEAGFRTLLIDADTRRGRLHRVMNMQRRPGLTDHLRGQAAESEIVQHTGSESLYFVGAGTRTETAPELLDSAAMSDFVRNLRTGPQRTAIIFDSPPLAAGIDAFTLSTLCGNLVLVVRLGATDRQLAGVKLDVLDRLPVRVLGAVLNDAPVRSSYGYYSYYLPGYENEREEGEPARIPGRMA